MSVGDCSYSKRDKFDVIIKAKITHLDDIFGLISKYAKKELLLPRSKADICLHIRDFWVALKEDKVVGCCALHIVWEDLAEIRSLAVEEDFRREGFGRGLVEKCLDEARDIGINKVFALTTALDFFKGLGFEEIDKRLLPRKIWTDCVNCPLFPDCGESAVMIELKDAIGGMD